MSSSPSVVAIKVSSRGYSLRSGNEQFGASDMSHGRVLLLPQRIRQLSPQQMICGSVKYYNHEIQSMSMQNQGIGLKSGIVLMMFDNQNRSSYQMFTPH